MMPRLSPARFVAPLLLLLGLAACSSGGCEGPLCAGDGGDNNPPGAPTGVSISGSGTQVTVTWTPGTNATSHRVTLSTPNEATRTQTAGATASSSTFSNLTPGSTYTGQVFAVNANGETPSASVVTTLPALTGAVRGTVTVDGAGRSGIAVELVNVDDPQQVFAQTTTGTGSYAFLEVEPGSYLVALLLAAPFTFENASDLVNVTAGATLTRDFAGTAQPGTLSLDTPLTGLEGSAFSLQTFELEFTAGGLAPPDGVDRSDGSTPAAREAGALSTRDWLVGRGVEIVPPQADATAQQGALVFTLSGGTGDADLCVTHPDGSDQLCSFEDTSDEMVSFPSPPDGTWVIEVFGFTAFSGVTLAAEVSETVNACIVAPIQIGQTLAGTLAARPACMLASGQYYDVYELSGAASDAVLGNLASSAFDTFLGVTAVGADLSAWDLTVDGCDWAELLACNDDFYDPDGDSTTDSQGGLQLPDDGTYWVVATSFNGGATGDYMAQARPAVPVTVENHLISPLRMFFNGVFGGAIGFTDEASPQVTTIFAPAEDTISTVWQLWRIYSNDNDEPLGIQGGGIFQTESNPTALGYTIDNVIGANVLFAPVVSNQTSIPLLQAVNWGLAEEVRCFCTIASSDGDYRMGYYPLVDGSNHAVFQAGSDYAMAPLGLETVDPASVEDLSGRWFIQWIESSGVPLAVGRKTVASAASAPSAVPLREDRPLPAGSPLLGATQQRSAAHPKVASKRPRP